MGVAVKDQLGACTCDDCGELVGVGQALAPLGERVQRRVVDEDDAETPGLSVLTQHGLEAAKLRREALDHVLFHGPPGLGKTTLASILAHELGVEITHTSGPVIERPGDLAGLLTNLPPRGILFVDEIHRMSPVVEEYLYPALEDFTIDIMLDRGPSARSVKFNLERFTLVGATTRSGLLSSPLRARFGLTMRLDYYGAEHLARIVHAQGGRLDGLYICPHRPDEHCQCRKPRPGLLLQAQQEHNLDLAGSYVVDDAATDVELARVLPVIEALHACVEVPISIDTTKAAVARGFSFVCAGTDTSLLAGAARAAVEGLQ